MTKKILLLLIILASAGVLVAVNRSATTAAPLPTVSFEPTPLTLPAVPSSDTVTIRVADVDNISSYEFKITYDPQAIRVDSVEILDPPSGVSILPIAQDIDEEKGQITATVLALGNQNLLSDTSASLVRINLTALKEGSSSLNFLEANLFDINYDPVSVGTSDGVVQTPKPPTPPPEGNGAIDGWLVLDKNGDGVWGSGDEILKDVVVSPVVIQGDINTTIPFCSQTHNQYRGEMFYLSGRAECPVGTGPAPEVDPNAIPVGQYFVRFTAPDGYEPKGAYYTDQSVFNGNPNAPSRQAAGRLLGPNFVLVEGVDISKNVTTHLSFLVTASSQPPTPPESLTLSLTAGWNKLTGLKITGKTQGVLSMIDSQCGQGAAVAASHLKSGWWETYRAGYGGARFAFDSGKTYYFLLSRNCNWNP